MYQYFRTKEAVANCSGAMEADTISKNGRSSKSHTSRRNFKIFAFVLIAVIFFTFDTCKKDDKNTEVPQTVIDKVNEAKEFDVMPVWDRKEEILKGTHTTETVGSDDINDPKLRRYSDPNLPCYTFNVDWECDSIKVSASENPDDFAMVDPLASVLWPGNLVQGGTLSSGVPASIPVTKRQPGNVSLAIVSSGSDGATMYRTVDKMQFSNVNQAMNDILSEYKGQGYAKYSFQFNFIEDDEDLKFVFNASFQGYGATAKAKLRINNNRKYKYVLIKLHQSYFTMAYDDPAGLDGVFTPDIKVKDLENYTGNGNPICYISSVTYGRVFWVLYESTASRDSLSMALNAAYTGFGVDVKANLNMEHKKTMEQTTATVFQLGGDGEGSFTNAMSINLEAIQTFMDQGVNFSAKNVGAPISYTVKYLKNAQTVRLNNTMEYTVQRCESKVTVNKCPELPQLKTNTVENYTATTAELGGYIDIAGTPEYTECGVCYAITPNPILANNKTEIPSTGTGRFSAMVSGLESKKTYYVRAYAINDVGTAYGEQMSFTTLEACPVLSTNNVTTYTTTTATLGGNITDAGTPAYTERGVCYATTPYPTISNNKTPYAGTGTGNFSVNVTGLTANTVYYVRAYAISQACDVVYGEQVPFATGTVLTITTNEVKDIFSTTATFGGNIGSVGTPPYTERGVVWATTQNPTIYNGRQAFAGTGTGSFSVPVTGLLPDKPYYVRAYAIQDGTPKYGNQVSFTTPSLYRQYKDKSGNLQVATSDIINYDPEQHSSLGTSGLPLWVHVSGTKVAKGRITIRGNVHIILEDGSHLDASNGGINVAGGHSLTIYVQEAGTGKLTAKGSSNSAGIGGNRTESGGTITINGGTINATGTSSGGLAGGGAGIGGGGSYLHDGRDYGTGGDGGTIEINGGTITVTGGNAGNGGGDGDMINGGGGAGAGLGGGGGSGRTTGWGGANGGNAGKITINGGTVIPKGGARGSGRSGGGLFGPGGGGGGGAAAAIGGGGGGASGGRGGITGADGGAGSIVTVSTSNVNGGKGGYGGSSSAGGGFDGGNGGDKGIYSKGTKAVISLP